MTSPADPPPHVDAEDHELAALLATGAGELLVELRAELDAAGEHPAHLKELGDAIANRWLMDQLAQHRPDDPVLSEEQYEHPESTRTRLASRRAWIVDPLDGTREFSEVPRPDWAVHVALAIDGIAACGAVSLPAFSVTYATGAAGVPLVVPPHDGAPRIIVSRSRPPWEALEICTQLNGELVRMGSAGAKAMAIIRGEADIYAHSGGQYEWDSCAPIAVAAAAGLWVSRLDGSPIRYNRPDPYLPDLLICRPEYAEAAIKAADYRYG
ncbi:MAG: 3'(2'),5'-bisphosphate nucleotidase CysQ [Actinobacteria bacterium]|nr:3'(2'),5'-bisphosphate nucleotidase CysQ [Actinomycetota bacterium]